MKNRREPACAPSTRCNDHAARRLHFAFSTQLQRIACGAVPANSDEHIIEGQKLLAIVEPYAGECDRFDSTCTSQCSFDGVSCCFYWKRNQNAIDLEWIWVDPDDWDLASVLGHIGHQPILACHYDRPAALEVEICHMISLYDCQRAPKGSQFAP